MLEKIGKLFQGDTSDKNIDTEVDIEKEKFYFKSELRILLLHLEQAFDGPQNHYEINNITNEKVKALADKFLDGNGDLIVDKDLPAKVEELFRQPIDQGPHVQGGRLSDSLSALVGATERLMKTQGIDIKISWPTLKASYNIRQEPEKDPNYVKPFMDVAFEEMSDEDKSAYIDRISKPRAKEENKEESDIEAFARITKSMPEKDIDVLRRMFSKEK